MIPVNGETGLGGSKWADAFRHFTPFTILISDPDFINDDESDRHQDYELWLEKPVPYEPTSQYLHNRTGEDNADAHIKRQIMGHEVVVAEMDGKLDFGTWEQIFYEEFVGQRWKRVWKS